ncbi:MAG: 4-amino-4-deoxy-L-arabinose transferase [Candidatus Margulisbacteria bacterium]|nr:4-amino-4-deoxy-L-arabinose transferase [Candidatus Margulisiibacteriota bacterium]MBU1021728.1 4-amino-4-deoxy-L-arabinose transferase [Candidatus Margulisiibacteriota bacterium]MBU1729474.1 4-amino-4-deoxy-L-arabinose transferase [Candidatus Margulisiibacteriota bacterium]MBU1955425.1 4-amino-4-deoxy-L-arabinose transferase [Candidatus Margulisiibacteriota bacterium]
MINYILLFISIGMAVIGQLLMKHGMRMIGFFPLSQLFSRFFSIIFNPFVFSGISMFALSAIVWLVVLSRFELSFVYPMVSVGYVIVALASMFFFHESITLVRWLGIGTIILGVFLISRS